VLAALALITMASAATADTWTAVRLRGTVLQLVAGVWQPLHRNDVVPDETLIRTLNNGYVDFARGAETVSLGPTTQIQIFDKGGAKPFTTVQQSFGTVTVDAEVKNVQHFAVETPYLAAVVKGTKFIVTSGKKGATVKVLRGHVEVDDFKTKTRTLITVGQSAGVGDGASSSSNMSVSGHGVLPQVVDSVGNVVDAAGNIVGKVEGSANGLLNGVADGLRGLTGNSGKGSSGSGSSTSGSSNSGSDSDNSGSNDSGGGGLGGLLGGLHLKLGYPLDAVDKSAADLGLWV
jgi:hypothetical protein